MNVHVALVTGASSGIGRAAAIRLAERGMAVVLTHRDRGDDARAAVAEIEAAGGSAVATRLDVTELESFAGFAAWLHGTLASRWQTVRLTALVNNAGIGGGARFSEVTEDRFDTLHRTLCKGPFFLTQRLLPLLGAGSAIVNVGSTSALPTGIVPGYSAYAAQKGALHVLTHCWARELAAARIRVNAVAPGSTRTRIAGDAFAAMSAPALAELAGRVALGRVGEPDDVAGAIAFLAGPESGWITGEILECSGGERP